MVRAGLMEKVMSKTNDTSYDVAATSERELTGAELETVTGAWFGFVLKNTKVQENQEQLQALETFAKALNKAQG